MAFNSSEVKGLLIANYTTATLSILSELTVLIYHCISQNKATIATKLIISLFISDLIFNVANVLSFAIEDDAICYTQAFLKYFSVCSSVLQVLSLTILSYTQLIRRNNNVQKQSSWLLIQNYIVSFIMASLPLILMAFNFDLAYGRSNSIACGIRSESLLIYLETIPIAGIILIMAIITYKIYRKMQEAELEIQISIFRLIAYPLALLVCWVPGQVYIVIRLSVGQPYFGFALVDIIFSRLNGFFNFLIYGRNLMRDKNRIKTTTSLRELLTSQQKTFSSIETISSGVIENTQKF